MIGQQPDAPAGRAGQPADAGGPGIDCPACSAAQEAVDRLLARCNDGDDALDLNWLAFCNSHAWQVSGHPAVVRQMGAARLQAALERLRDNDAANRRSSRGVEGPTEVDACPFCVAMTAAALATLSATSAAPGGPLCVPHLCTALEQAGGREHIQALASSTITQFDALEEELSELIRKSDYRFRDEPRGPESTAWRRAALLLAGTRGVHWSLRRAPAIEG